MKYGNCRAKCPILNGVHQSYNVWLYADQSQRDVKVENSWNLKIFWPASEPCREATSKYSDSIFPVPILPTRSHPPCKYEGMGMHSLDTLVCQSWGKYRWNMEIAGQNVLFWRGSIKVTTSDCMRISHSGTSKLKIPEILKIFWPASEPCREVTSKHMTLYFLCLSYVPFLPTQ